MNIINYEYDNNKNVSDIILSTYKKKNLDNDLLELELDFEVKKKLPVNYGNKWSEIEKENLIKLLKESSKLEDFDKEIITNIANKLGRTEGGIKGEIKKIIYDKYIKGYTIDFIANEFNLNYKYVKSIIKIYLEKDCDADLNILEKENKLLKFKIENIKLRNELNLLLEK